MTFAAVMAHHPAAWVRRVRITVFLILTDALWAHRHLAFVAFVMWRTFTLHACAVVSAGAAIFAIVAARIRLTLFAPVAGVALTNRFHQPDGASTVTVAIAIADTLLTVRTRVSTRTLALANAGGCIQLAHSVVLAHEIMAILAL